MAAGISNFFAKKDKPGPGAPSKSPEPSTRSKSSGSSSSYKEPEKSSSPLPARRATAPSGPSSSVFSTSPGRSLDTMSRSTHPDIGRRSPATSVSLDAEKEKEEDKAEDEASEGTSPRRTVAGTAAKFAMPGMGGGGGGANFLAEMRAKRATMKSPGAVTKVSWIYIAKYSSSGLMTDTLVVEEGTTNLEWVHSRSPIMCIQP